MSEPPQHAPDEATPPAPGEPPPIPCAHPLRDNMGWAPPRERLEYFGGRNPSPQPQTSFGTQAFLGVIWFIASLFMTWFVGATTNQVPIALGFLAVANVTVCILLETKFGWRGFKVGVLIGIPLSCLISAGFLFVICGGLRR